MNKAGFLHSYDALHTASGVREAAPRESAFGESLLWRSAAGCQGVLRAMSAENDSPGESQIICYIKIKSVLACWRCFGFTRDETTERIFSCPLTQIIAE